MMDAIDSALAELFSEAPLGLIVSRATSGPAICTIVVPGSTEEMSFEGANEVMAKAGAVAKAMIVLAGGDNIPAVIRSDQVRH